MGGRTAEADEGGAEAGAEDECVVHVPRVREGEAVVEDVRHEVEHARVGAQPQRREHRHIATATATTAAVTTAFTLGGGHCRSRLARRLGLLGRGGGRQRGQRGDDEHEAGSTAGGEAEEEVGDGAGRLHEAEHEGGADEAGGAGELEDGPEDAVVPLERQRRLARHLLLTEPLGDTPRLVRRQPAEVDALACPQDGRAHAEQHGGGEAQRPDRPRTPASAARGVVCAHVRRKERGDQGGIGRHPEDHAGLRPDVREELGRGDAQERECHVDGHELDGREARRRGDRPGKRLRGVEGREGEEEGEALQREQPEEERARAAGHERAVSNNIKERLRCHARPG